MKTMTKKELKQKLIAIRNGGMITPLLEELSDELNTRIKIPNGWRWGQFWFNFLQWLAYDKGYNASNSYRLADTFHINDRELYRLAEEFTEELNKNV